MCSSDVYTYVYPDGSKDKTPPHTQLCSAARHGFPCSNEVVYRHPPQQVPFPGSMPASAPVAPTYLSAYPPTPSYSSRGSTPNYLSGNESDRSGGYRSGSSTSRRKSSKRNSTTNAPAVYINGQRIFETSSSSSRRGDRIMHVESPRTPPQAFAIPNTAPASPSTPYIIETSPHRRASISPSSSSRRRPYIVEEGSHLNVDIRDATRPSRKSHSRHTSTSSYEYDSDSARKERRRLREAEKEQRRAAERATRLHDRINQANAKIADRPAVPMGAAPSASVDASYYSREREAELVEAVRKLEIKEEARKRKKQEKEEQEAQKQRLMERMQPTRRATVGGGSRRHRVLYDDGSYRYHD